MSGKKVEEPMRRAKVWYTQFRAFVDIYFQIMSREKTALFWVFVWPTVWYVLTSQFLAGTESPEAKASQAVALGIFAAFGVTLSGFAGGFSRDMDAKRYRKYRSLPLKPSADFAGRFTRGFLIAVLSFVFLLLVGLLDGASFSVRSSFSPLIVVASLFLFCMIGMSTALLLTVVVDKTEYVMTIANAGQVIVFFVTGFNGTVTDLIPSNFRPTLNYIPNSLATRIQIYHLVDTDYSADQNPITPPEMPDSPEHLVFLMVLTLVVTGIASFIMKRVVYESDIGE